MATENNWFLDQVNFVENLTPHPRSDHEWDLHFMGIAAFISSLSKCASRNIGAILVKDKDIVSMGFNGSPHGSNLCQSRKNTCPRKTLGFPSGMGLEVCPAQHAERNVIAQAAKAGKNTKGTTAYMSCGIPCQQCAGGLIQAGVSRIVCYEKYTNDSLRGANVVGNKYDDLGEILLREAKVDIHEMDKLEILDYVKNVVDDLLKR